mmetsp:Transcript_23790/g.67268  ORF Transcript_23790/g.67268 Transcript_23790/m.67268 type:complete len:272 (+) Transcript_23790:68-883(+)
MHSKKSLYFFLSSFLCSAFNALDCFTRLLSALIELESFSMISTIFAATAVFKSPGCNDSSAKPASMSDRCLNTMSPPFSSDRLMTISPVGSFPYPKKNVDAKVMGGQNVTLPGSQNAFFILDLPCAFGSSNKKYSSLSVLCASDSRCCNRSSGVWTIEMLGFVTPGNFSSKNFDTSASITVASSPSAMAMDAGSRPATSATFINRATTMPTPSESFMDGPITSSNMKCLPTLMTLIQKLDGSARMDSLCFTTLTFAIFSESRAFNEFKKIE